MDRSATTRGSPDVGHDLPRPAHRRSLAPGRPSRHQGTTRGAGAVSADSALAAVGAHVHGGLALEIVAALQVVKVVGAPLEVDARGGTRDLHVRAAHRIFRQKARLPPIPERDPPVVVRNLHRSSLVRPSPSVRNTPRALPFLPGSKYRSRQGKKRSAPAKAPRLSRAGRRERWAPSTGGTPPPR